MRMLLPLFMLIPFAALGQDSTGASAARAGDESLTCDQLKAEMSSLGGQTNMRGLVAEQTAAGLALANRERVAGEATQAPTSRDGNQRNATEQHDAEAASAANAQDEAAADEGRRGGFLRRAAGGGGGGGGFGRRGLGGLGPDSDSAAADAEAERDAQRTAELEASQARLASATSSPGMQRSFRLMELAQAKKCAFLDEGAPRR